LGSYLSLQTIIIGEIFLVLFAVGGYLVFYTLEKNNQLRETNFSLSRQLKDAKSRAKGLRVQVQELNTQIQQLEKSLAEKSKVDSDLEDKIATIETEKEKLNAKVEQLSQKKSKIQKQNDSLASDIKTLQTQLKSASEAPAKNIEPAESYKDLYYELKNSIAFNMSGGEQVIDMLRDRLVENGNINESKQMDQLKEKYNSIGSMVGLVTDVELFDSNEQEEQTKMELQQIVDAEMLVDDMELSLRDLDGFENKNTADLTLSQKEMDLLIEEINHLTEIKNSLSNDLNKTSIQLKAFIAKAQMFQAQKEQISLQKATNAQMHQNLTKLGSDYRLLSRRFKTLESRNDILNTQLTRDSKDEEFVKNLEDMREKLEKKEESMDRLLLEKDMLEQQFMLMSEESEIELKSSKTLQRLQSEHELLEEQFLGLLKEFESKDS